MQQDPLTGRVLDGKYVLGPVIGQGAIGRVYRARQISLEREVAIKILSPGYTNHPEAIARFRLEAKAASRISHPGIVTVLDCGKDPHGLLYLVIEYMRGRDLFDVAQKEAPLDSARVARLMQQVSLALAHAHAHGVIHRDLKPENLRVLEDPLAPAARREVVKIYDFGVAHVTRGLTRVFTQVGVMVGTPYYMSPEQAASSEVFPQSDLYSCGVIMFLLATGTLPFVAPSPLEVAAMHVKKRPPAPSTINPAIDPRLETIILCCLAKDPTKRPSSAADLATMLDPITRNDGASAAEPRELPLPKSRLRRPPRWTTAWAVGATSALATLAAMQWARGSGTTAVASAAAAPACAADLSAVNGNVIPAAENASPEIAPVPLLTPTDVGAPADSARTPNTVPAGRATRGGKPGQARPASHL